MKKSVKLAALAMMFLTAAMTACTTPSGNGDGGEEFVLGDGSKDNFEITENTTLTYPNTYTLKGFVYVPDGVTLTIEPGVVIKGDKATQGTLIVERGGKIMAQGTADRPIVFTSGTDYERAAGIRSRTCPGRWILLVSPSLTF